MEDSKKLDIEYRLRNGIGCFVGYDYPLMDAHNVQVTEEDKYTPLDKKLGDMLETIKMSNSANQVLIDDLDERVGNLEASSGTSGTSGTTETATAESYFTFTEVDGSLGNAYSISCADTTLERIIIPRTYNDKPITQIGSFQGCSSLKHITIPSTITKIEQYAFKNCSELIDIHIPKSVTYLDSFTFSGCSNLVALTIPHSVTTMNSHVITREGCPCVVVYCEAESKPTGWNNNWNGSNGIFGTPVVWGANLADIKPAVRAAEHAQSAGVASAVEGIALGSLGATKSSSSSNYYKVPLGKVNNIVPDHILSISGSIYSSDAMNEFPFHFTFPSSDSQLTFSCVYLDSARGSTSLKPIIAAMKCFVKLEVTHPNTYLSFDISHYVYENGEMVYTADDDNNLIKQLNNVVIIRRK